MSGTRAGTDAAGQITRKRKAGAALFALMLSTASVGVMATPVLAQSFAFQSVQVEGNARIETATILTYAGIARGQPVTAGELNAAARRIRDSGLFESVDVVPRGSTLVIQVVERPTINRISFEGNRRIDDEDLSPIVESTPRRVFNPAQAELDAARITEAYAQQGRIAARVTPRLIRRSDNRIDLVFEIFEGDVVEIERIGFVGNSEYSDGRLRRALGTKQAGIFRALVRSDTLIEDRIEFDRQVLSDFYASRGYVDFRVNSVNAELSEERDGYFVTFNVVEGQQFRFGEITVTSDLPDVDTDLFLDALRVRQGVVYSPSVVENSIARLERLSIKEGLDFVRVEPRISRDDRALELDVEFVITRGPRVFVERIDIEGNTTTLDRVVRRQFDTVEGDPFNPREIRESAERIRALGFFANAEVNAREGSSPEQVVVDVDVEEQPTGSLGFGGTYSTESGFGFNVTFREDNFLGRGQRLSLGVSTGASAQNYSFNFVEPAFLGRDVAFGLSLSYAETSRAETAYNTAVGVFRPSLTFPVSEYGRLQLRYTAEYSEISDVSDDLGDIIFNESQVGARTSSAIGYTYSYDTRNRGLNPNAGVLLEFGQDFAGLGGDISFVRSTARAVAQTTAFNEEVTLRASFQGGAINFREGQSNVTDRYLLGSSIMRGFEFGGIGPREINPSNRAGESTNDALGGHYFAVASFEAEFPLGLPEEYGITGGLFYDVGSVWGTNGGDFVVGDEFDLRHVVGASIFWDTPIGPLRFNFSEALVKESFDKERNFELTIRTDF
ncbi:outer membrane protein assembly factor BamA [Pseudaestuariivita sp.]|uniref:outer membrane protein assembly factor BamA n=1 Tax=Pseudaestuariivita sp. TaxID=2211669 RepID=UPI004059DF95